MANVLDSDILESQFELQSCSYIHFRTNTFVKGKSPLNYPGMVSLLFFFKDGLGIKHTMKVDMSLNKETKPNWNLLT